MLSLKSTPPNDAASPCRRPPTRASASGPRAMGSRHAAPRAPGAAGGAPGCLRGAAWDAAQAVEGARCGRGAFVLWVALPKGWCKRTPKLTTASFIFNICKNRNKVMSWVYGPLFHMSNGLASTDLFILFEPRAFSQNLPLLFGGLALLKMLHLFQRLDSSMEPRCTACTVIFMRQNRIER